MDSVTGISVSSRTLCNKASARGPAASRLSSSEFAGGQRTRQAGWASGSRDIFGIWRGAGERNRSRSEQRKITNATMNEGHYI